MKYPVNLSVEASKDINGIYEYIAVALGEKEIAVNMINLLEKNILSFDEMPGRYKLYWNEPWKSRGLHIMTVKKYLVFYTVDDNTKSVNIIRVIYSSRDIDDVLN